MSQAERIEEVALTARREAAERDATAAEAIRKVKALDSQTCSLVLRNKQSHSCEVS